MRLSQNVYEAGLRRCSIGHVQGRRGRDSCAWMTKGWTLMTSGLARDR